MSTCCREDVDGLNKGTYDGLDLEDSVLAMQLPEAKAWLATPSSPKVHPPSSMEFGQALGRLRVGERIARLGWHGEGMWLELQRPGAGNKLTEPYIYMVIPLETGQLLGPQSARVVPWVASQADLLAFDWYVLSA